MKSFFYALFVLISVAYASIARINEIHAKKTQRDYQILGVAPSANKSELKKAYIKLCMELHPDKLKQSFTPRQLVRKEWCDKVLNAGSEAFKIMSNSYERMVAIIERQEAQVQAQQEYLRQEAARKKREQELRKKQMEEERLQREREQKIREEQERRERDLRAFRLARQAEINRENLRLQQERMRKADANRAAEQRKVQEAIRRQEEIEAARRKKKEDSDLAYAEENLKSLLKQHEKTEAMLKAAAEAQKKEALEAKLANDPEFRAQHEAKLAEEEAKREAEEEYKAWSDDLEMRQKILIRSSQKAKALLRREWIRDLRSKGLVPVINNTPKTPEANEKYRPSRPMKRKWSESSEDEEDDSEFQWDMSYRDYQAMRSSRKKARRDQALDEYLI